MARLTEAQYDEIRALIRDPKYGGSERNRDRARTSLKRLGLIRFDRKAWTWQVTPEATALLSERARGDGG